MKRKLTSALKEECSPEHQLDVWVGVMNSLKESKPEFDQFEEKMSNMVQAAMEKLDKDIMVALKELETTTGYDWTPYMDDFDISRWEKGDFQNEIKKFVIGKIKEESAHL